MTKRSWGQPGGKGGSAACEKAIAPIGAFSYRDNNYCDNLILVLETKPLKRKIS